LERNTTSRLGRAVSTLRQDLKENGRRHMNTVDRENTGIDADWNRIDIGSVTDRL